MAIEEYIPSISLLTPSLLKESISYFFTLIPALSTFYSPLYSPAVSVATEPSSPWFRPELDLAKQTSSFYEESPRSPAFEQVRGCYW